MLPAYGTGIQKRIHTVYWKIKKEGLSAARTRAHAISLMMMLRCSTTPGGAQPARLRVMDQFDEGVLSHGFSVSKQPTSFRARRAGLTGTMKITQPSLLGKCSSGNRSGRSTQRTSFPMRNTPLGAFYHAHFTMSFLFSSTSIFCLWLFHRSFPCFASGTCRPTSRL